MEKPVDRLRRKMRELHADACFVSCSDPHQSEAVAPRWKTVQWLSGFSESAAWALVTPAEAHFWTDGRYIEQAKKEVDPASFAVHNHSELKVASWTDLAGRILPAGSRLLLDGDVVSEYLLRKLARLESLQGIALCPVPGLFDDLWPDRPGLPRGAVREISDKWTGESRSEKIRRVREFLHEKGCGAALCCGLDDIAWLTNLRGEENPPNLFFHAWAWIEHDRSLLFVLPKEISPEARSNLEADGWVLMPYSALAETVRGLAPGKTVWTDPAKTPAGFSDLLKDCTRRFEAPDPVNTLKARKTPAEMDAVRDANRREALAVLRFMRWVELQAAGGTLPDEFTLGQKLEMFRGRDDRYLGPANIPIVAFGPNAALPHYRPGREKSSPAPASGFLLFDVCAHYETGTTDLTRVVAIGDLTDEERLDYTLVLKTHIALATQKFPEGTTGNLIDAIAKAGHWRRSLNYGHGTGHGIGFASVHEGPGKIITEFSPAFPYAKETALEPGMLFSNEPGLYRPGKHGVRLENTVLVREDETNAFGKFLGFETITFLPFERKAILKEALTSEELSWLNGYHHEVFQKLSDGLDEDERAWLLEKTRPL